MKSFELLCGLNRHRRRRWARAVALQVPCPHRTAVCHASETQKASWEVSQIVPRLLAALAPCSGEQRDPNAVSLPAARQCQRPLTRRRLRRTHHRRGSRDERGNLSTERRCHRCAARRTWTAPSTAHRHARCEPWQWRATHSQLQRSAAVHAARWRCLEQCSWACWGSQHRYGTPRRRNNSFGGACGGHGLRALRHARPCRSWMYTTTVWALQQVVAHR